MALWNAKFLFLRDINKLGKAGRVIDGEIREHLAVHFDVLLLQPGDELGIAQTVQAACSIDTGDPQATEITLAEFASDECITQAAGNLFLGGAVLFGFRSPVAFRQLHNLAATLMGIDSPLDTCHFCFPPCR